MPANGVNKSLALGGGLGFGFAGGNTLSTANLDSQNIIGPTGPSSQHQQIHQSYYYDEFLTKELAYTLGVELRLLKQKLQSLFHK